MKAEGKKRGGKKERMGETTARLGYIGLLGMKGEPRRGEGGIEPERKKYVVKLD